MTSQGRRTRFETSQIGRCRIVAATNSVPAKGGVIMPMQRL